MYRICLFCLMLYIDVRERLRLSLLAEAPRNRILPASAFGGMLFGQHRWKELHQSLPAVPHVLYL